MRLFHLLVLVGFGVVLLNGEDLPKAEGMDVVRAAKALTAAVKGPQSNVAQGKAWEQDIAALTDARPEIHTQAMSALIRRGQPVVGDLLVLAQDPDSRLRMRVAAVLSAIGGDDATKELLRLSHDADPGVSEFATLGLGRAKGPGSFERLAEVLTASDPSLRQAAARALGQHGDPAGLALLCGYVRERDDLVRRDMRDNLARVATHPQAVPVLIDLITQRAGAERVALIDATAGIGDPRLSPVLASVVAANDASVSALAARMLAVNGDSRAVEVLCHAAATSRDVLIRDEAAATLRRLTGHTAAAGTAWELWWRDHRDDVVALQPRDQLLAELHDPARTTTSAELAAFPVATLGALIDGTLGQGAAWWPARAFAALAADQPARWTADLLARIDRTIDNRDRVRLIVLLDELGDPAAVDGLRRLHEAAVKETAVKAETRGPERAALRTALERRGVTVR